MFNFTTVVFDGTSPTFYFTNTSGRNTSSSNTKNVLQVCQSSGYYSVDHFESKMQHEHMHSYQPLHCYKHLMMLYTISSYEPPSPWLPPLANTSHVYTILNLVHRPGLWRDQISCPLTTSWGAYKGHGLLAKTAGRKIAPAANTEVHWLHKEKDKISESQ